MKPGASFSIRDSTHFDLNGGQGEAWCLLIHAAASLSIWLSCLRSLDQEMKPGAFNTGINTFLLFLHRITSGRRSVSRSRGPRLFSAYSGLLRVVGGAVPCSRDSHSSTCPAHLKPSLHASGGAEGPHMIGRKSALLVIFDWLDCQF